MRHRLRQCLAHRGRAQRNVGDEERREQRSGRVEARRVHTADDDETAEQGGRGVVRVLFDLGGQRQQSAWRKLLVGECLGGEQTGDACRGGGAEASGERDLVAHLDAHDRWLQAELLHPVLDADQEAIAGIESDLILPLPLHGDQFRAGVDRRDGHVEPQVEGDGQRVEAWAQVGTACRRIHRNPLRPFGHLATAANGHRRPACATGSVTNRAARGSRRRLRRLPERAPRWRRPYPDP